MGTTGQTGPRRVRSFVRRTGRVTAGQQRALAELWPRWGVEPPADTLDLDTLFGRQAPRVMEIGIGNGDVLLTMAAQYPEQDFLGVEVHEPGIGHCLLGLEKAGLDNVRLIREDAVVVLQHWLAGACLDRVNLFFPDPWPKKRHHKRRIVQPAFVALVAARLKPGGLLHMATDWAPYAEHIEEVLAASADFVPLAADSDRPPTKFERRGERLGHEIRDLRYRRQ
ncbi:MAG: tRNA (guanosine(46)-N7)-methyltransferase TrmB [Chromatiales bacterium]|nr:MAG: tRNA (guanosine(46)-N7)-methyltransferase TrmB [Chromatiales bacterium]